MRSITFLRRMFIAQYLSHHVAILSSHRKRQYIYRLQKWAVMKNKKKDSRPTPEPSLPDPGKSGTLAGNQQGLEEESAPRPDEDRDTLHAPPATLAPRSAALKTFLDHRYADYPDLMQNLKAACSSYCSRSRRHSGLAFFSEACRPHTTHHR